MSLGYNILSINRRNVLLWTPRILAIWDLEMPLASKFRTLLAFFESFSFFDSAENGRPSFFPESPPPSQTRRLRPYFVCHFQDGSFLLMSRPNNFLISKSPKSA